MMSEKSQQSIETFRNGHNCAQSVLSVFANDFGLSKNICLKLAGPFGSGIAQMQETCGAVTGALMAIGLQYGKGENGTNEDKTRAYALSKQFISEFKNKHKTICCLDLLDGLNTSTPEGMDKAIELNLFQLKCAKYIQTAVELTENIITQ
jgi:C_GCAxxG_C_C family probable redox protein